MGGKEDYASLVRKILKSYAKNHTDKSIFLIIAVINIDIKTMIGSYLKMHNIITIQMDAIG